VAVAAMELAGLAVVVLVCQK
ncbi:hypothetical protein A2U01_0081333, partial [Trifolium medium]|nr:hypothetical protein [Trifolium medium]